ncbi:uncharacterized protein LOC127283115 isoform X2 [Leptopilina boulardi]|nr:uncharacterized protein LOC127283115 isoform X2 [Leptopilina boulardi]
MRRRTGPVQQWVDSIPSPTTSTSSPSKLTESSKDLNNITSSSPLVLCTLSKEILNETEELKQTIMTASTPIAVPNSPATTISAPSNPIPHHRLIRDPSLQSDSSHCSSVESFLELRKADPEAVLLNLGFGGYPSSPQENGPLSRIPKRFLQPSKLKGIAINDFVKQQQETNESLDTASLGYRGLTGSPYVAPSEIVQKIMERLREHESHEIETHSGFNVGNEQNIQEGRLSVLSPDNRQFLDQPRSKSPDMRNKRMIIGQRSFAFGCDGDLIEIDSKSPKINLSTNDVIKSATNNSDSIDLIDNQITDKIIKPLNRRYSLNDNLHLIRNQASSSSSTNNYDDRNIFNKNEIMNQQEFTTNKHNIELKNDKKQKQSIVDDNHNLPNVSRQLSEVPLEILNRSMTFEESRRSSGATTFSDGSCDTVISNRKRSLKRQARIYDEFESFDSNATIENDDKSFDANSIDINIEMKNRPNPLQLVSNIRDRVCEKVSEMEETLNIDLDDVHESDSKLSDDNDDDDDDSDVNNHLCDEATGDNQCCSENRHLCCQNDKLGQICKHDANHMGCCYHESSERCWRKMEKIMQKNKKLEKMVVKSKRGIVEIREMLSSVLSVRMEPGF